jgi:hypothetical protein
MKSFQTDKQVNIYEYYAVSGYNAAISGNLLPTFRDNISAPSSGVTNQAYEYIHINVMIALCFGRNIKTRIQVS